MDRVAAPRAGARMSFLEIEPNALDRGCGAGQLSSAQSVQRRAGAMQMQSQNPTSPPLPDLPPILPEFPQPKPEIKEPPPTIN